MNKTVKEALNEKIEYLKKGYPFSIIKRDWKTYEFSNLADIKNKCTKEEWEELEKMNVKETRMYFEEYVIEVE